MGDAQAWHYPADHTIVIREVLVASRFRIEDPRESLLLHSLWRYYERFHTTQFTDTRQLVTTWEDEYPREQWEGFLTGAGYRKTAPAVFTKEPVAPQQW